LVTVCNKHFIETAEPLVLSGSQDCALVQVSFAEDYWSFQMTQISFLPSHVGQ